MLSQEQRQELRTIWANLDLGTRSKNWETTDRAAQRLAEFLIDVPVDAL